MAFQQASSCTPDTPTRSQAAGESVHCGEPAAAETPAHELGVRSFDGIVSDKCTEELECQKPLCSAGTLGRGEAESQAVSWVPST